MARNLLQIIQTVQQELGLPVATAVIGNSDVTTTQMYGMAVAELDELRRVRDWTFLQNEYNLAVNPPLITTGDTTINSPIITNIPDTSTIIPYSFQIAGGNIPLASRVISVDSATQVTMSMESTATSVSEQLTVMQDTYPEPVDFDHFINNTWWDRTNHWSLLGPTSPQDDQWHRSGIFATGPRRYFQQQGPYTNNYRLWPPPAELVEPLQIAFNYVSKYAVKQAGVIFPPILKELFTLDTDIPLLDDRAMIMGIKYRFWMQKGFAWAALRTDYDNHVERQKSRDGGAKTLSLVRLNPNTFLSSNNIQDANFPGPTGTNGS
jgi:hypothetical protein